MNEKTNQDETGAKPDERSEELLPAVVGCDSEDESRAQLFNQLIKLGDMMGDGLHYESDGGWIKREYRKITDLLYPEEKAARLRHKNNNINKRAEKAIIDNKCTCGGQLKQSRSGSKVLKCTKCKNKFKLRTKK